MQLAQPFEHELSGCDAIFWLRRNSRLWRQAAMMDTDSHTPNHWIAAGVRHAVFMRVLPTLRHDLVTPLSLVRMSVLLLKRQLRAYPVDVMGCTQRVAMLDVQTAAMAADLSGLRGWVVSAAAGGVTRPALVKRCVALLRPRFGRHGVSIQVDPALDGNAVQRLWPGETSLGYLLLAALCCVADTRPDLGAITIAPDGPDGLLLTAHQRTVSTQPAQAPPANDGGLQIDEEALRCLAAELGFPVHFDKQGLVLRLQAA